MTATPTAPHSVKPASTEILTLQFTRGLAAALVVIVHLIERLVRRGIVTAGPDDPIWLLGYLGVATFFVISGFIMVHTTWHRFGQSGWPRAFFLRRIIRIVPFYYAITALSVVFSVYTEKYSTNGIYVAPTAIQILKSLCFIPYVDPDGLFLPVYKLGWTLEYEMFFYAVFACGLFFRRARGLIGVTWILATLVLIGRWVQPVTQTSSTSDVAAWFFTRPILLYFLIGMALAAILRWRGPIVTRIPHPVLVAFAALVLVTAGTTGTVPYYLAAVFAVAVTAMVGPQRRTGPFAALSRFVGDASYSVYLTHSFLLGAIALVATRAPVGRAWGITLSVIAALAICFPIGWCVWRFAEVPINRRFKNWVSRGIGRGVGGGL